MSGMTDTPRWLRISSAEGVSGALAPSAMIFARILGGVLLGDRRAGGGGNQDVAIGFEHLVERDVLAAGEALYVAGGLDVLGQPRHVEPSA